MSRYISRFKVSILLTIVFSIVAGQAIAYPMICSMTDRDSTSMEMSMSQSVVERTGVAPDTSETSAISQVHCELVCGYCLNYNLTMADVNGTYSIKSASRQPNHYQSFLDSTILDKLFRPPKSV